MILDEYFYFATHFISSLIILAFSTLVYLKNTKSNVNKYFLFVGLTYFIWLFFSAFAMAAKNQAGVLFLYKVCYTGVLLLPLSIQYLINAFMKRREKLILTISWFLIVILLLSLWFSKLFISGLYKYPWGFYPRASYILHPFLIVYVGVLLTRCSLLLLLFMGRKSIGLIEKLRTKYFLLSIVTLFFCSIDFFPNYGVNIFPFGFIFIVVFIFISGYAILKYQLLDIQVAVTRTTIFVIIYCIAIGIPLILATWFREYLVNIFGLYWWMSPLILLMFFAAAGPFLFIYIDHKLESALFKEQRRYQQIIRHAAIAMSRIHKLEELLDFIAHLITKTLKIRFVEIYLFHKDSDSYSLHIIRGKDNATNTVIKEDSPLIKWFLQKRSALLYEEDLEETMRSLDATLAIPIFLGKQLSGFFILGEKTTGRIYNRDDLNLFGTLANQAALAIENAKFYEQEKEMFERLAQAEKMASIGFMVDGITHQLKNYLGSFLLGSEGIIVDTQELNAIQIPPEAKKINSNIRKVAELMVAGVKQGTEVIRSILKYSRPSEKNFEPQDIKTAIEKTMSLIKLKTYFSEIDLLINLDNLPKITCDIQQIQEVFFNLLDNSLSAIKERKNNLREESYRGEINISGKEKNKDTLEITIEDNGIGIKDIDTRKIFSPFFTTKLGANKGTGIGLYMVKRIITEIHQGKITFESEYKIGTRFIIELPVAK